MNLKYVAIVRKIRAFIKEHYKEMYLKEAGSAKFFVKNNGDTTLERQGSLTDREVRKIRAFIKEHYKEMYLKWIEIADTGFYGQK